MQNGFCSGLKLMEKAWNIHTYLLIQLAHHGVNPLISQRLLLFVLNYYLRFVIIYFRKKNIINTCELVCLRFIIRELTAYFEYKKKHF